MWNLVQPGTVLTFKSAVRFDLPLHLVRRPGPQLIWLLELETQETKWLRKCYRNWIRGPEDDKRSKDLQNSNLDVELYFPG